MTGQLRAQHRTTSQIGQVGQTNSGLISSRCWIPSAARAPFSASSPPNPGSASGQRLDRRDADDRASATALCVAREPVGDELVVGVLPKKSFPSRVNGKSSITSL